MLDQNIKTQLKAYLERLESPIELVAALATPKLGRRVLLPSKRAVTLSESSAISVTNSLI
ncbi:hypothetical protein ITE14_18495 [Acinetobacter baumannii]|nr:hypothetical protein [Acinetobacter baumannii]